MTNYQIIYEKGRDKKYIQKYGTSEHPLRFLGYKGECKKENLIVEGTCSKNDLEYTISVISIAHNINRMNLIDRKTKKTFKELRK